MKWLCDLRLLVVLIIPPGLAFVPVSNVRPSPLRMVALTDSRSSAASDRAVQIARIVWKTLFPLLGTIFDGSNEFWAREIANLSNAKRLTESIEKLGPTYVKFGQALSAREDLLPAILCQALSKLQSEMAATMTTETAQKVIRDDLRSVLGESELNILLASLEPVAAASIGQVYKAQLPNYGAVAIKVQRPGVRELVLADEHLFKSVAVFLEGITIGGQRWMSSRVVDATSEFMGRVKEELDYRNEAKNMVKFALLYGNDPEMNVVVPEVLTDYCTDNILVMEWIDGTKLTEFTAEDTDCLEENLALLQAASTATLSQLFETGVLHADPHSGNLLKIKHNDKIQLGYLDFGMVSEIPTSVRDGLVCAVAQCIFARNIPAVVDLFAELQLLQPHTLEDSAERSALVDAMEDILNKVLTYPEDDEGNTDRTAIPKLRFDSLLGGLTLLVTRFEFQLPPYFLNNVRALATLEGITRKLNPDTNSMRAVYPFALKRLLGNPSNSRVIEDTLMDLVREPRTGRVTRERLMRLIGDSAHLTGRSKRQVIVDVLKTKGGRRMLRKLSWKMVRGEKRKHSSKYRAYPSKLSKYFGL